MLSLILKYIVFFFAWLQVNTCQLCVFLFSRAFKLYKRIQNYTNRRFTNAIQNVNNAEPFTRDTSSCVKIGPSGVIINTVPVFLLSR